MGSGLGRPARPQANVALVTISAKSDRASTCEKRPGRYLQAGCNHARGRDLPYRLEARRVSRNAGQECKRAKRRQRHPAPVSAIPALGAVTKTEVPTIPTLIVSTPHSLSPRRRAGRPENGPRPRTGPLPRSREANSFRIDAAAKRL